MFFLSDILKSGNEDEILEYIESDKFSTYETDHLSNNILHIGADVGLNIFEFLIKNIRKENLKELLLGKNRRSYYPLNLVVYHSDNEDQVLRIFEFLEKKIGKILVPEIFKKTFLGARWPTMTKCYPNMMDFLAQYDDENNLPYIAISNNLHLDMIRRVMTKENVYLDKNIRAALKTDNPKIFEIMVELRPDILKKQFALDMNLLHLTIQYTTLNICEYILSNLKNLNSDSKLDLNLTTFVNYYTPRYGTPLSYAISSISKLFECRILMVELLLKYGANPNDENNSSILRIICEDEDIEVAELLFKYGLEISPDFYENIRSPFESSPFASKGERDEQKRVEENKKNIFWKKMRKLIDEYSIPDVKSAI